MRKVVMLFLVLALCVLFLSDTVYAGGRKRPQTRELPVILKTWEGPLPQLNQTKPPEFKSRLVVGSNVQKVASQELTMLPSEIGNFTAMPSCFSDYLAFKANRDLSRLSQDAIREKIAHSRANKVRDDEINASIEQIKLQFKTQMLEKQLELLNAARAPEQSIQSVKDALKMQRKLLAERANAVR